MIIEYFLEQRKLDSMRMLEKRSTAGMTKEEKKAAAEKKYEAMKVLINTGAFEFDGDWATSQRGTRINLISNPTFIKMEAQNADGYLPFFGTAQVAGYGQGGAIEFKGEVENYSLVFNDKKQKATIKFDIKGVTNENFDVIITLYENLNASVDETLNNNKLDIVFKIEETEKIYVQKMA